MKKKSVVISGALLIALVLTGIVYGPPLFKNLLTHAFNEASRDAFAGTLQLGEVSFDGKMRIRLDALKGDLQTREGPVPIEIRSVLSKDSLALFLIGKPVHFVFEGVKPVASNYQGLRGEAVVIAGEKWAFELQGEIESMGLEDIEWVNPDNLTGSTGRMIGSIVIKSDYRLEMLFKLKLEVQQPGGNIQARFFQMLVPLLPQAKDRLPLDKIAKAAGFVRYRDAQFDVELVNPETMKIFLHILVPEYNLNLNLNMEVRTDRENAFLDIAQWMGFVEIKM